jgi:predicted transcriptional regulator of viral defense system
MTKLDAFKLRKTIGREEFDYVQLTNALHEYSGVRQKINELLKSGVIVRVKKGLYIFGPDYQQSPVCIEVLANLIYGPSCISLEYALSFHGLIPERVDTITSITPKRDKEFNTPLGRFTYRYLAAEKYPHGIEQVWLDETHPVFMASAEKALCDYIVLNKVTEPDSDIGEFLTMDLRIDTSKLNSKRISSLNKFYRNPVIERIAEAI